MLASRQLRGLLAGMGVTGSLLAAIAVGFLLTGGVLAFRSWPAAAPSQSERALRVSPPAPEKVVPEPLVVPAAARPAPAAGLVRAGGAVPAPARPPAPVERRRATSQLPQATAPASTPTAPVAQTASPSTPAPAVAPVADAVRSTTAGVARTVRGATHATPLAGAGEQAARAVESGGQAVAALVGGGQGARGAH